MLMSQRVLIAQAQVLKDARPWAKVACWGEYLTLACPHNEVAQRGAPCLVLRQRCKNLSASTIVQEVGRTACRGEYPTSVRPKRCLESSEQRCLRSMYIHRPLYRSHLDRGFVGGFAVTNGGCDPDSHN